VQGDCTTYYLGLLEVETALGSPDLFGVWYGAFMARLRREDPDQEYFMQQIDLLVEGQ